jgi:uncharacterized damage-inducible protein DinB
MTAELTLILVRELRGFEREIDLCPDDDLLWKTMPGIANSIGNLATHVCGNLQHFIGHVLGGTSYVRDRDHEFGRRSGTRAGLIEEIRETIQVVETILPSLDPESLSRQFPEQVGGATFTARLFLLHLSAHLAHHLGQAGYLRRALTADSRSSGPLPLTALAGSRA